MNILAFGEIIWDIFEPEQHLGGAPLNFAAHASMLGGKSWIVSTVGVDDYGKEAISHINEIGVNSEFVSVSEKETGKCIVSLDENRIPQYDLLKNVAYDYIEPIQTNKNFDVFAFGTLALRDNYNRDSLNTILKTFSFSEIYVDINIRPPFYSRESVLLCFSNATILKISDEELPLVTKYVSEEDMSEKQAVLTIAEKFPQVKIIILTKGENGSLCYDCKGKTFYCCDAKKTDVVSTVGAGDSFGAAFVSKYMKGASIPECLEFASEISAFVCSHKEAVPDTSSFNKKA